MFGRKKSQERLDWELWWSAGYGYTDDVKKLLAAGANPSAGYNAALRRAASHYHTETVKVLQEAINKQDTQRRNEWNCDTERGLEAVDTFINKRDAQRAKEKLELETQRNPLLTGSGLTIPKYGPDDMETLLREATAGQEQMRFPTRAGALGRDYIPLPQL